MLVKFKIGVLRDIFIFSTLLAINIQVYAGQQLQQSSNSEYSAIIVEKIYLQTDRDYYSRGDIIWFKAYLVEDPDLLLSYNCMNLHVDLISSESEIVESHTIRLEGGLGKGDIELPENLTPGVYILRAYTSYMRNFTDIQIFEKALMIFDSSGKVEEDRK